MTDLLKQLGTFQKTLKKRLTLKGVSQEFDTYRIPIELLIYNIKNDRIATFITQHLDEKGDLPEDSNELNNIIENYIVQSNSDAFSKTKTNIKIYGQMEPAVVMSDGIVIDGNRRFSILRQLYRDEKSNKNSYGYLEAVILPRDQYNDKDIKRLELNLQHGIESKVDYNPIERLVGVYRDLIQDNHPFTIEEYADETQISINKVKQEVEIAKLMVDYLIFINQPEKFHIARKQKIDGPLREVNKILNSKKIDENSKVDIKELLFANILSLDGDVTRKIRDLKPVLEKPDSREEILDQVDDYLDDISDELSSEFVVNEGMKTGIINIEKSTKRGISELTSKFVENEKFTNAKNQPIQYLKSSLERLEKVDKDAVKRFDNELREEFNKYISAINEKLNNLSEISDA